MCTMAKRILDILVALFGLIVLAPVFIVIAVLIKLDSPGSIFFRGERVGQHGKIFYILKFRSMVSGAPQKGAALSAASRTTNTATYGCPSQRR